MEEDGEVVQDDGQVLQELRRLREARRHIQATSRPPASAVDGGERRRALFWDGGRSPAREAEAEERAAFLGSFTAPRHLVEETAQVRASSARPDRKSVV